ncbi:MAG: hypothetical protein CMJ54_01590 [Planctomycetaceae bacterium]|nr:hypothetical protein [Planctomycetaceae bacterium]
MARYKAIPFLLTLLVGAGGLTYFWFDLPRRTRQGFAGDLYHQRYQAAAGMLLPPSALRVDSEGGLVLVDEAGDSTTVPKAKLPFKIVAGNGGPEHDFKMMALGPSTNGTLDSPPVTLYLAVVGERVTIEAVED